MDRKVYDATLQLRTTNLEESINFYVDVLGFELEFRYEDFYAGIIIGKTHLHLKLVDDPDPSIPFVREGGHIHLFISIDDVDTEAHRLSELGVKPFLEPYDPPWGNREFYITDNQGHVLAYSQGGEQS